VFFLSVLLVGLILSKQCFPADYSSSSHRHDDLLKVGETLIYDGKIWGLQVGTLSAEMDKGEILGRSDVYHIVYRMKTTGFMRFFLDVDKIVNVCVDSVTGLPYRREKQTNRDGTGYKTQEYIWFNQDKQQVLLRFPEQRSTATELLLEMLPKLTTTTNKEEPRQDSPGASRGSERVITRLLDPYSLMYYLRVAKLYVGWSQSVEVLRDWRIEKVRIEVTEQETVKVPAGKFDCFVVHSINEKGKIWISSGLRQIPVKFSLYTDGRKFTVFLNEVRRICNTLGGEG